MTTIMLIDDHAIVREGFKRLLEAHPDFEVVAEAADMDAALATAQRRQPQVIVLDLSLGASGTGLRLLPTLRAMLPDAKILILSMHDDYALVLRALEAGANGYVTKGAAAEELVEALQRVIAGEVVLSSDLASRKTQSAHVPHLTQRECETLRGLLSNLPPKAIAVELGISDKTLYRHRANLMEKLGARTTNDLARIVRERGLLVGLKN